MVKFNIDATHVCIFAEPCIVASDQIVDEEQKRRKDRDRKALFVKSVPLDATIDDLKSLHPTILSVRHVPGRTYAYLFHRPLLFENLFIGMRISTLSRHLHARRHTTLLQTRRSNAAPNWSSTFVAKKHKIDQTEVLVAIISEQFNIYTRSTGR
jgi:hypothetical protein